jgi:hypothetical protein
MTLLAGTTTVTAGISSGTGMSKAMFDALKSALGLTEVVTNQSALSEVAKTTNALAAAIIDYLKANAVITANPTLTVPSGIAVSTAGSATAQTGATTAAGSATGTVSSTLT